jgi:thiol:disulfide interchange protein DsbA
MAMNLPARRRRLLLALCAAPLVPMMASAYAPVAGDDYTAITPPQPAPPGKTIEVIEFFGFWCPHCYAFLDDFEAWMRRQPVDVSLRYVPVAFRDEMLPLSQAYYALEKLKKVEALHRKLYEAIHRDKRRLSDADSIADFMAANGIDRAQWLATYNSFTVITNTRRSAQVWQAYQVDSVPSMAIDGQYLTAPDIVRTHTHADALATADVLIAQARKRRR